MLNETGSVDLKGIDPNELTTTELTTDNLPSLVKLGITVNGDCGLGNRIIYHTDTTSFRNIRINLNGYKDNLIVIGRSDDTRILFNFYGNCNQAIIADTTGRHQLDITFHKDLSRLRIGPDCSSNLVYFLLEGPDRHIEVGHGCMFSWGIYIRASDSHAIIDIDTKQQINLPESITIEPYVWLAQDVVVMRGTRIGTGSVVGARSLITSDIPSACLAVGVPARVLRRDVTWTRPSQPVPVEIENALAERGLA